MNKKTMVIVGMGSGLSLSVAKRFGKEGFKLILMARSKDSLRKYVEELAAMGIEACAYSVDVSDFDGYRKTYREAAEACGTPDLVFYNVGITAADTEADKNPETLMQHYAVDVAAAYNCILCADTPEFAAKKGAILVTGGGIAFHPHAAYLPLSLDKAALRSLILAVAPGLQEKGIFLGTVQVSGTIGATDYFAPDRIAETYREMYEKQDTVEVIYRDLQ